MKKVLVIGGSSDIGDCICQEFNRDYEVISTYYTAQKEDKNYKQFACNLRSIESIDKLFENIKELDLVVTSSFPFIESDPLNFEGYRKINPFLEGHVYLFSKAAKILKKGGRIINLLGQSVDCGLPSAPHYGASFAYLDNLSKSVNATYGRKGKLSIHNILMGPVETKLWNGVSRESRKNFENKVLEFLQPEQIALEVRHIAEAKIPPTKLILDGFYSLPE